MDLLEAEKRTKKWVRGEINVFPDFRSMEEIRKGKRLVEENNYWWERALAKRTNLLLEDFKIRQLDKRYKKW